MKGKGGKGAPHTDLLVCFPSRAHLALMPKPICSPARSSESTKRRHQHHLYSHHTPVSRSNNRGGQASPLIWAKTKPMASEISEPTSPKVTCAGQIKVKQKHSSGKNWQSVMEEIERLHNHRKHKKRPSWVESTLGFKKDIMQFLTCLRSIRFDLRCFGSFRGSDIISDEEVDEEEFEEENQVGVEESDNCTSRTVFSKWFMVLQENQSNGLSKEEKFGERRDDKDGSCHGGSVVVDPSVPPKNALLLMRCRSAPAKGWIEKKEREEEEEEEEEEAEKKTKPASEEEKKKESLVLMSYAPDFFKVSTDIAKETWVVGGSRDPLSRSRSWKR
ncbi:uncharacterized protein LOC122644171 [Telopea speciosissima]|uniref:uncharacterized protein LOC122644171 n=1 Tax=Telopea speciosissima TaxID=54955 RepID=UPI001CC61EEF|nr:uncharacterized protein LOC122644171 [Telopea speciosissima]